MRTLTLAAVVAAMTLLMSTTSYAAGQTPAAIPSDSSANMVLAMEQPAVDSAVSPGAGPETSAEPISHRATTAHTEMTAPNAGVTATAARQAMPSGQSVNAAYAAPGRHMERATPSYEELNRRIEALSREITALREDLGKLKSQEHGAR